MANITIWQAGTTAMWYTKLNHRVWTELDVTFGVWPVGPGHQGGAVWTTDDWQTANWTAATWERNEPNPYGGYDEKWMVKILLGPTPYPVRFRFALYAEDGAGDGCWDNNNGWDYEHTV